MANTQEQLYMLTQPSSNRHQVTFDDLSFANFSYQDEGDWSSQDVFDIPEDNSVFPQSGYSQLLGEQLGTTRERNCLMKRITDLESTAVDNHIRELLHDRPSDLTILAENNDNVRCLVCFNDYRIVVLNEPHS